MGNFYENLFKIFTGTIVVIEKVELMNSLTECLQMLLYGTTDDIDVSIHPNFRLILIMREMYSQIGTTYAA